MARALHVLIVEDSEPDAQLVLRALRRGGYETDHQIIETGEDMRAALASRRWDVVISDFSMPHFSGQEALAIVKEMAIDVPFIIVSGTVGEEIAVEALRAGAHDFMLKDRLARLVPAIEREMRESKLRRDQIAERARAESERDRLLADLREAVSARDTFLLIASHEFRTPLTALKLTIQSLLRAHRRGELITMPTDGISATLDTVDRQVIRLEVLIQSLLDVTRIAIDGVALTRTTVDLRDVVSAAIMHTTEVNRQYPSELVVDAPEPVIGSWDAPRLETAAANLISNAMKFAGRKAVDVRVSAHDGVARLTVVDRGIGISADQQARIFEKFERAVPEHHYGGLGLGLWIVRQVVEAHGGTVRVTSEPNAGSTFVVELPQLTSSAAAAPTR